MKKICLQVNSMEDISKKRSVANFEKFVFWFSVIDIFFLPYFPLISVSFSVPLIAVWMFFHFKELFTGKESIMFLFMCLFMVFGTLIGILYPEELRWETTFGTTVKRFFQYIICFGYYFFYRAFFKRNRININKILMYFAFYATIFAIFFLVSPRTYAEIKIIINPVDNHTARYLAGTHLYRFNYLWTDPNNIAYLLDAVVLWFALDAKETFKNKLVILALASLVNLSTASNGGMIILFVSLMFVILRQILLLRRESKIRLGTLHTIVVAGLIIFVVLRFTPIYQIVKTELVDKLFARLMYYSTSGNLSGGRFNDLRIAFEYLNPILLFCGVGKEGFTTENGHLYWIGMYGVPAYIAFMSIAFGKFKEVPWERYIWVFPMFVAFTLNIAIGEFKWLAIFFLLLAASRYMKYNVDN